MNCFPCFTSQKSKKSLSKKEPGSAPQENVTTRTPDIKKPGSDDPNQVDCSNIQAQAFTFRELATATRNFRQECLLGEGGFGRVYKGTLAATSQVVAVKQLDRNGMQGGNKEFLVEVLMLSLLHHENLVKLVGYCADGDQRVLVHEFMPGGSLEGRLFENESGKPPLDWFTRMKIASGAAQALEYLHDKANPPVIFRDLKSSNILLDDDLNPKLSDFGLAKLAGGDKMNNVPPRVMGTYGYSAPEYVRNGQLTLKSDVYSFGVVLLELITGRRAIDTTRPHEEQNLVSWAQPLFRNPKSFPDMADPRLNKHFPEKDLNQAVAIAAMCLQEEAAARPLMSDVVVTLSFLSTVPSEVIPASLPPPASPSKDSISGESGKESHRRHSSDDEVSDSDEEGNDENQDDGAQHDSDSDSQEGNTETKEFYSKSSRKSSRRSINSSEDGSVSSSFSNKSSKKSHGVNGNLSQKSSRKSSVKVGDLSQKSSRKASGKVGDLSQKSSRKSSVKVGDLSQKSSRKSSVKIGDLSQKSSKKSVKIGELSQESSRKSSVKVGELSQKSNRKSSARVLSHKTSMGSEDGSVAFEHADSRASYGNVSSGRNSSWESQDESLTFEHDGSRLSQGNISFGLISSGGSLSDHYSSRRSEEGSIHLDHTSSRGSEEGSLHFDHTNSRGSDE